MLIETLRKLWFGEQNDIFAYTNTNNGTCTAIS